MKELEEQNTKETLELVKREHKMVKWEDERERARMLQGMELSRAAGIPLLVLAHLPWHMTSSWVAQDADDAMSESSGTARDWWESTRPHLTKPVLKLKVPIPVESEEEAQDHVRATLAISQEEAEEIGFVPSALGEPRGLFTGVTIVAVKRPSDTGR